MNSDSWRQAKAMLLALLMFIPIVWGLVWGTVQLNRYTYLETRARRALPESCVMQKSWMSNFANEPTCAQLLDDYRNGHTEFTGYNRGYAEALEGFSLSHGEQLCMQRLTPDALKKHMDVRSRQQQAYARQSMEPDLKFAPGPCVVSMGEEKGCLEVAVVYGILLDLLNAIPDLGFKKAFTMEEVEGKCQDKFWIKGIAEYEAKMFCEYVRDGYGYYRCEVVSCDKGQP